MQLADRTGIKCDHCGMAFKEDFTYFNLDARRYTFSSTFSLDLIKRQPVTTSQDVCQECFDKLSQRVVESFAIYQADKIRKCEISAHMLSGITFHISAQRIQVNMSRQPFVCVKCRQPKSSLDKCTCGSTKFIRPAKTTIAHNVLDFDICEAVMKDWQTRASKDNEWDTKS